jgi:protein-disulfide isomerase
MPERGDRSGWRVAERRCGVRHGTGGRTRRDVLAAGAGALAAFAGCLDGDGDGGGETLENHPAAANLGDQPTLGADPGEGEATVIAFEDPSCTRCRAFERNTLPEIKSELTDPGKGTFVFRGYPVVYPWGEPATEALEAVFDRDADAFRALKDHYYATQAEFDTENVLERTESFLADETSLDAPGVIADVEEGAHADAVQADLDAGGNAEIGRTTPVVLLFKSDSYRTKAQGSVSFDLIANALDL